MKIVHISTNYRGGAGIAAFRLHNALLNKGIDSTFVSLGDESLTDIKGNKTILISLKNIFLEKIFHRFKKETGLDNRFSLELKKINPQLTYTTVSLPISRYKLHKIKEIQEADIINLHGIAHILNYKSFFKKIQKPIVWTLHDINPIAGIFHLRTDESFNFVVSAELNNQIIEYKKKCYSNISKIAIVSPSQWLYEESIKRKVFKIKENYVIPNMLPDYYFKDIDTFDLKNQYKVTSDKVNILFVIGDVHDKNKGFDVLIEAFNYFKKEDIRLLIVGNGCIDKFEDFEKIMFGHINNEKMMIDIYNLADLLVIPSMDENLPNVLIEALSTGTPVVSFKIGGMVEYLEPGINGELADDLNSEALSKALKKAIQNLNQYSKNSIKEQAIMSFSENENVVKYISVYNSFKN